MNIDMVVEFFMGLHTREFGFEGGDLGNDPLPFHSCAVGSLGQMIFCIF
jgi:hypothetical protein